MKTQLSVSRKGKAANGPRIVNGDTLGNRRREIFEAVARRAYELFEQRGRAHGSHDEDWYRAEMEMLQPVEVEIADTDPVVTVRAGVGGFRASEIQVGVEPRRVTIAGTHQESRTGRKGGTVRTENSTGRMFREVDLPCDVDATDATAILRDGVLEVALRKAAAPKVRRAI